MNPSAAPQAAPSQQVTLSSVFPELANLHRHTAGLVEKLPNCNETELAAILNHLRTANNALAGQSEVISVPELKKQEATALAEIAAFKASFIECHLAGRITLKLGEKTLNDLITDGIKVAGYLGLKGVQSYQAFLDSPFARDHQSQIPKDCVTFEIEGHVDGSEGHHQGTQKTKFMSSNQAVPSLKTIVAAHLAYAIATNGEASLIPHKQDAYNYPVKFDGGLVNTAPNGGIQITQGIQRGFETVATTRVTFHFA